MDEHSTDPGPSTGSRVNESALSACRQPPAVVLWSPSSHREGAFLGGSRFYRTALYPPVVLSLQAAPSPRPRSRPPALALDPGSPFQGPRPTPARVPWHEGPSLLHHLEWVHIAPSPPLRVLTMKLAAVGVRFVAVYLMIDGKLSGGCGWRVAGGAEQGSSAGSQGPGF